MSDYTKELLNDMPIGVSIFDMTDPIQRCVYINDFQVQNGDYSREQYYEHGILKPIAPATEFDSGTAEYYAKVFAETGMIGQVVISVEREDGTLTHWLTAWREAEWEGKPSMFAFANNITEVIEARMLREKEVVERTEELNRQKEIAKAL